MTKPSPALLPLPQRIDDGAVDAQLLEHIDAAAAGVFHEHDAGDAVVRRGAAIKFARLLAGKVLRVHTASVLWQQGWGNAV